MSSCHNNPVRAVGGDQPRGESGVVENSRADDSPSRASGEHPLDVHRRSQSAGDLDRRAVPGRGDDPVDDRAVRPVARARPVEIDDVEPPRSPIDEPNGDLDRVVRLGRLAGEVALPEADDAAATQVDRRQEIEGCHLPP